MPPPHDIRSPSRSSVAEEETEEVVLATNPDNEGEANGDVQPFLRLPQPFGIAITRWPA